LGFLANAQRVLGIYNLIPHVPGGTADQDQNRGEEVTGIAAADMPRNYLPPERKKLLFWGGKDWERFEKKKKRRLGEEP